MKALILTTHTGGGHDAAANAVHLALEARGVSCDVLDSVAFGGEAFSRTVSRTYIRTVVRSPGTFGTIYHIGDAVSRANRDRVRSPVYLVNAAYAGRLGDAVEELRPDIVVCTHLFPGQSMTSLRKRGRYSGVLGMVQTDYTMIPFAQEVKADLLFIGHPDIMPECLAKGVREETVHVTGIPVDPACVRRTDRTYGTRSLKLLLCGGSMGAGSLPATVRALQPLLGDSVLQVVCGTNEEALSLIQNLAWEDPRIQPLGQVTPLHNLMREADLVITKSGGLTVTEAMVLGTPMILYGSIEGCETINAELLERNGLACYARDEAALLASVRQLAQAPECRRRMVLRQFEQIPPDPAARCARLLVEAADAQRNHEEAYDA